MSGCASAGVAGGVAFQTVDVTAIRIVAIGTVGLIAHIIEEKPASVTGLAISGICTTGLAVCVTGLTHVTNLNIGLRSAGCNALRTLE